MTLSEWAGAFRRYWWAVLVCMALLAGASYATTKTATKVYTSNTSVFFYVGAAQNVTELNEGTVYAQYQLQSYAQLVTSPNVLEPVVEELGLAMSAADLAGHVTVVAPQQLTLLTITVTDSDPTQAWKISQAVGKQLQATVSSTIPKAKGGSLMLESKLIPDSAPPSAASSPSLSTNLTIGLAGGLALGALAAAALELRRKHRAGATSKKDAVTGVRSTT